MQLQARTLGCKAPEELSAAFPEWEGCNFIPENLHPKSFRGYIGHNTNVWAAASRAGIKARRRVARPPPPPLLRAQTASAPGRQSASARHMRGPARQRGAT